jgi:hypothetical protein
VECVAEKVEESGVSEESSTSSDTTSPISSPMECKKDLVTGNPEYDKPLGEYDYAFKNSNKQKRKDNFMKKGWFKF